jgi:hypothetical protein
LTMIGDSRILLLDIFGIQIYYAVPPLNNIFRRF